MDYSFFNRVLRIDEKTVNALKTIFGDEITEYLLAGDKLIEGVITLKPSGEAIIIDFDENAHICQYCSVNEATVCEDCLNDEIEEATASLEAEIYELKKKING